MRYFLVSVCLLVGLLSFLASCQKSETPAWLLSETQLENLLYDYHMAQSMADAYHIEDSIYKTAVQAALDKHQMTSELLDSNLQYYAHHVKALHEIYQRLEERFNAAAGLSLVSRSGDSEFSMSGDTANVWLDSRFMALTNSELNAVRTFTIAADTSYHMYDNFQLQGDVLFLGQSVENKDNNLLLGMVVTYENDSIQTSTRAVSHNQQFMLNLRCDSALHIQNVSGYLMIGSKTGNSILLQNLRLLRIHHPEKKVEQKPADEQTPEE